MRRTNLRVLLIGISIIAIATMAFAIVGCTTSATPTRAPDPTKPPAAATSAPATQTTKTAAEPTKPAAEATKPAAQPTKPAAEAPKPAASGPLAQVTFGEASTFAYAPVFWAVDNGYFKEAGINLSFSTVAAAGDAVPFLTTGQLDLSGGGISAAQFNAYARGLDVKIVAPLGVIPANRGTVALMVPTDLYNALPTKTVADLKGKKVALNARGGLVEYMFLQTLRNTNLTVKDFDLVTLNPADMPAALANKSVDAAVVAEPFITRTSQMGAAKIMDDKILNGRGTTVLFASPKLIKERPDVLRNFMVAYLRAVRDLMDVNKLYDNDRMAAWVKYTKLQPEVIKAMAPFTWEPNLNIDKEILSDLQKFFMAQGVTNYQQTIALDVMMDENFGKYALEKLGPWKK